jgi:AcrR family transcriptional regulator
MIWVRPLHLKKDMPELALSARAGTQERILAQAETLFMVHGYEATSLRLITNGAGVNLAAVNYHFGSKEELFQAVLTRRLDPLNVERMKLLDALETKYAPKAVALPEILSAMFLPALQLARDPHRGGQNFLRLLGRAYVDPAPFIRHLLSEQYAPMINRFKAAFGKALPHLSRDDLTMRLHFVMGAMAYTLAGTDALKLISTINPDEPADDSLLLRKLAPFLTAGLQAPATDSLAVL